MAVTVQILPASMTSLPIPVGSSSNAVPLASAEFPAEISPGESKQFLLQAFRSFAEAAESLERSYGMLRAEVGRLRGELEQSNAGLQRSLEEIPHRQHLDRILDGLPCGVLVADASGMISLLNPEGRRMLGATAAENAGASPSLLSLPKNWRDLFLRARAMRGEQEQRFEDQHGEERWLAVRHAAVPATARKDIKARAARIMISIGLPAIMSRFSFCAM